MGCVQSVKLKPSFHENITVLELQASIDPSPTVIDESSNVVLRYRTPYFRASAQVQVPPMLCKEIWTVGWIQACNQMDFFNIYGNEGVWHDAAAELCKTISQDVSDVYGPTSWDCFLNSRKVEHTPIKTKACPLPANFGWNIIDLNTTSLISSWELPELRCGQIQAISDSDGVNYPWYGCTTEIYTIVGPTKKSTKLTVSMNDNFCPSVTWSVPVGTTSSPPLLSSIQRDQRFTTWLVAMNETTAEMVLLRTIQWRMQLCIKVDPKKPLGQRATVMEPVFQEQPQVLVRNEPIPTNALLKPNANDAQVLMWRPRNGKPIVVIPPKYHEGYFLSF